MRVDPSQIVPTSDDTSERWIAFHKALRSWFGKQSANAYFLKFWNQRGGAGSSADTHDLRDYMKDQGVDLTTDWKGEITDFGEGILDWFSDTANVIRVVIIGTAVLGVGLIAFYIIRGTNRGKSAGQMIIESPVSPVGRLKALRGTRSLGSPKTLKLIQ
jgi:hypothetical protein